MNVKVLHLNPKQPGKADLLDLFAQGIRNVSPEDHVVIEDYTRRMDLGDDCDVLVIHGEPRFHGSKRKDMVRVEVWKQQVLERKKPVIILESQILGRFAFTDNDYHRVGINSTLFKGDFNNDKCPPDRWNDLVGLSLKRTRRHGEHVLLILQNPGDASMDGVDPFEWGVSSVKALRQYTSRKIIIRPHPLAYTFPEAVHAQIRTIPNVEVSFDKTFERCWCAVAYSSGMSVNAVLNGIPVLSRSVRNNMANPVAFFSFDMIEDAPMPSMDIRRQWVYDLAYTQWSTNEIRYGSPWLHLRQKLIDDYL